MALGPSIRRRCCRMDERQWVAEVRLREKGERFLVFNSLSNSTGAASSAVVRVAIIESVAAFTFSRLVFCSSLFAWPKFIKNCESVRGGKKRRKFHPSLPPPPSVELSGSEGGRYRYGLRIREYFILRLGRYFHFRHRLAVRSVTSFNIFR